MNKLVIVDSCDLVTICAQTRTRMSVIAESSTIYAELNFIKHPQAKKLGKINLDKKYKDPHLIKKQAKQKEKLTRKETKKVTKIYRCNARKLKNESSYEEYEIDDSVLSALDWEDFCREYVEMIEANYDPENDVYV